MVQAEAFQPVEASSQLWRYRPSPTDTPTDLHSTTVSRWGLLTASWDIQQLTDTESGFQVGAVVGGAQGFTDESGVQTFEVDESKGWSNLEPTCSVVQGGAQPVVQGGGVHPQVHQLAGDGGVPQHLARHYGRPRHTCRTWIIYSCDQASWVLRIQSSSRYSAGNSSERLLSLHTHRSPDAGAFADE